MATPEPASLALRGVAYDTGTNFSTGQGELSRIMWNEDHMVEEISLISDQLNCNAVTVYGTDHSRLAATASAALDNGLRVRLQPRLVDHTQDEILDHLAEGARLAQALRADGGDVELTVGAVHLIFTPGIAPGHPYHQRMANAYADLDHYLLEPDGRIDFTEAAGPLNDFLGRAAATARSIFDGPLSYSAAPFEQVDWTPFDSIGLMYQYLPTYLPAAADHISLISPYRKWNKPIDIAEYGTATYTDAEKMAFRFYDIVDRYQDPPRVLDTYTRDESAQAAYHLKMLGIFQEAGVRGATVSELVHPTHPHHFDPSLDLDTASMCIVKTIRDDFADAGSDYRLEPKESFHAIADHYAHIGFQEAHR
ncbi:abortive infection protein [Actinomadura litoris]|uniref:Abortive infection protein n=1 Tax=Actinomadura litoris TaxID=2678616 RepID=A0A7K1L1X9_9ACTN|nr:abortive infection protein [Actinomadura litoris]MUN38387.1 abortive infection protein [Actinomadura litoris]